MQALRDTLRFWKEGLRAPKHTGALAPSSRWLGDMMARWLPAHASGPILELGPGTGVVTAALLRRGLDPRRLITIEVSEDLVRLLQSRFPDIRIICGDAFNLTQTLRTHLGACPTFSAVFSSLPLLNFSPADRVRLINQASEILEPGSPFVQFTYKLLRPRSLGSMACKDSKIVWLNLPPARVSVFGKPHHHAHHRSPASPAA